MNRSHPLYRISLFLWDALRFTILMGIEMIIAAVVWIVLNRLPIQPLLDSVQAFDPKASWHLTRSVGTVAYVMLATSTAWGIILSSQIVREITPAPIALEMHQSMAWLSIGLGAFHGFLLLFDRYYQYEILDLLIPFVRGPYRPIPVGLGIVGLYLILLTSASFGWQAWLGRKAWRFLHYGTYGAFALVTLHGILSGTDSDAIEMRLLYLVCTLIVLFLTNYRLMVVPAAKKSRRAA
jgi:hypothetical protein